ncbi:hypothetical protein BDZ89DRAFT_1056254 [Hymenopellis radicata]|nr:hypothetical protein BDZ89DRAFT_1056254 [Hymenopellis radicata]
MDFRRRLAAQANAAQQTSPAQPPPVTPRNRPRQSIAIHHSPASTPSISSSVPFDWNAARTRQPPPFSTPRSKIRPSTSGLATPRKAVIRKKSFFQKVSDFPARVAFELSIFPNNVPLPEPKTTAAIIGGFLHFMHLCVRVSQVRAVPDSDIGWENMHREANGLSLFDWTLPVTICLILASVANAILLFTRTRIYDFHRQTEPVSSPNAKFVSADLDFEPLVVPTLFERVSGGLWTACVAIIRFLFGWDFSSSKGASSRKASRVQQLEAWHPADRDVRLFCIYSPAHCLMWMATGSSNWIIMLLIMGFVGLQLHALVVSCYNLLVKDKEIIAAGVMQEYNEGFVYPRINPIRKDAATMTHQSEMVNLWED